jgi:hypothetical protein
VYDFYIIASDEVSGYVGKISDFPRGRIINYYYCRLGIWILDVTGACRCNEITNLTMGDIEDLGSAILVKVQDTKNYKLRSFIILGKFYLDICKNYAG